MLTTIIVAALTALVVSIVLVFAGAIQDRIIEQWRWNGGVCRKTGEPWIHFTTLRGSSRGYKDGHGSYMWVAYSDIDSGRRLKTFLVSRDREKEKEKEKEEAYTKPDEVLPE